ncbi:MAG: hypothetical protein LBT59_03565 [Clostridiales bacterium]|jgi:hypothetical protein|nr:hypothetical protein [Clostridiales bacterium]
MKPGFATRSPWTKTLPEEFLKRKHYDIEPYLPLLQRSGPEASLFRFDYYDVISDLYAEATFKQVYDWCDSQGLKTIGHLLGEETLAAQTYFGGDMLRAFKYLHIPALDHLGCGIGSLNAKFVASASHHYGKDRVACEAFGASGWNATYEEMVQCSNWLFQQGVNMIIMHGFYYSIRGERYNDFPPSYFFQWKYWDMMQEYVPMANRMMNMLSGGIAECDILVYSPIESFWDHFIPDLDVKTGFWEEGPWIQDSVASDIDRDFQLLCSHLSDENLDFSILGADAVINFKAENGLLANRITGAQYSILVLPYANILTDETARLLGMTLQLQADL